MILTASMLTDQLHEFGDPAGKIMRMRKEEKIFQLTRGLYETDPDVPGQCLAGAIYGPSYLSFDYALSLYNLIPEAVYAFTSATFKKRRTKNYINRFGRYMYRDVPEAAFPFGITIRKEHGYEYRIAVPEKALCDKLYAMPPVTSVKDIRKMLFDDLRINEDEFANLDAERILQIGDMYHSNNLKYLVKYIWGKSRVTGVEK